MSDKYKKLKCLFYTYFLFFCNYDNWKAKIKSSGNLFRNPVLVKVFNMEQKSDSIFKTHNIWSCENNCICLVPKYKNNAAAHSSSFIFKYITGKQSCHYSLHHPGWNFKLHCACRPNVVRFDLFPLLRWISNKNVMEFLIKYWN